MNFKYILRLFLIFLFSISILKVHGQICHGGEPFYFNKNFKNFSDSAIFNKSIQKIIINKINSEEFNNRNYQFKQSIKREKGIGVYGIAIDTLINFFEANTRVIQVDSGSFYYLSIKSETAYAIQLSFKNFYLQEGSHLFIISKSSNRYIGALNKLNNNQFDKLNTFPLPGDEILIEYFEPKNVIRKSKLIIDKLIHKFVNDEGPWAIAGGASICNEPLNVGCPIGYGWEIESKSVGIILFDFTNFSYTNQIGIPQNQYWGYSSGVLLNNTSNNGVPYFLTSNHNIEDIFQEGTWPIQLSHPSNWIFVFDYNTFGCNTSPSNISNQLPITSITGAITINRDVGSNKTDYLLLRLNATPTDIHMIGATYAGWDANYDGGNKKEYIGIHHPQGDVKKICKGKSYIFSATNPRALQLNDYSKYLWNVKWSVGHTQLGSSGSPLFNKDHKVIGHLFYGNSSCGNSDLIDAYGSFSYIFPDIMLWLDPYSTGVKLCSSFDPVGNNHCQDGMQNVDETGIDCGGQDCPPCEWQFGGGGWGGIDHCHNGQYDFDLGELGVDCGGECVPCGNQKTCNDCLKNGDETQMDCGGSCVPCIVGCNSQSVLYTKTEQLIDKTVSSNSIICQGNVNINSNKVIEFRAKEEIVLKDGFSTSLNSNFRAINVECDCDEICDLPLFNWNGAYISNFNNLCINVSGASSYWVRVFGVLIHNNSLQTKVYETSGSVINGNFCIWDGTNADRYTYSKYKIEMKLFSGCSGEEKYFLIEDLHQLRSLTIDNFIDYSNLKNDVVISPNPTNGILKLSSLSKVEFNRETQVFDAQGRKVYEVRNSNGVEMNLDLTQLSKGFYFISYYLTGIEVPIVAKIILN